MNLRKPIFSEENKTFTFYMSLTGLVVWMLAAMMVLAAIGSFIFKIYQI